MGGLLVTVTRAGDGGVMIVLILVCVPLPFILRVVDTFFVVPSSVFVFTCVFCASDFSNAGDSKVKRVVSFDDT